MIAGLRWLAVSVDVHELSSGFEEAALSAFRYDSRVLGLPDVTLRDRSVIIKPPNH